MRLRRTPSKARSAQLVASALSEAGTARTNARAEAAAYRSLVAKLLGVLEGVYVHDDGTVTVTFTDRSAVGELAALISEPKSEGRPAGRPSDHPEQRR